jgi:hypothetical protein
LPIKSRDEEDATHFIATAAGFDRMNEASCRQRRRQRTVGTIVATAAVGYGVYRLAQWYFGGDDNKECCDGTVDGANESEQADTHHTSVALNDNGTENNSLKRAYHEHSFSLPRSVPYNIQIRAALMKACRQQVSNALPSFGRHLRRTIDVHTDVSEEKRILQHMRSLQGDNLLNELDRQEARLWESIKVKSLTLAISTAYANALVFLALTVSTHVVFGWQSRQERNQVVGNDDVQEVADIHRFVVRHVITSFVQRCDDTQESGLECLIKAVQAAIVANMAEWNVQDSAFLHVTPIQLDQAVESIYSRVVEQRPDCDPGATIGLMHFLINPLQLSVVSMETSPRDADPKNWYADNRSAQSILNETLDVLESPVCQDAQRECCSACLRQLQGKLFGRHCASAADPLASLPLTAILTSLRKLTKTFYSSGSTTTNEFVETWESLPSVLELCDVSFD